MFDDAARFPQRDGMPLPRILVLDHALSLLPTLRIWPYVLINPTGPPATGHLIVSPGTPGNGGEPEAHIFWPATLGTGRGGSTVHPSLSAEITCVNGHKLVPHLKSHTLGVSGAWGCITRILRDS